MSIILERSSKTFRTHILILREEVPRPPNAVPKPSGHRPNNFKAVPHYADLLKNGSIEGILRSPGKSQKEGQEDQGTLKQLEGVPLALLPLPGPPGVPSVLKKQIWEFY